MLYTYAVLPRRGQREKGWRPKRGLRTSRNAGHMGKLGKVAGREAKSIPTTAKKVERMCACSVQIKKQ